MLRFCALVALIAGCTEEPAKALFSLSANRTGDDFYSLPFPNDLRRHEDGTLDLSLFPTNSLLLDDLRAHIESLDGFGLNAAIFARFDNGIDPATLPDPAGSITPSASVYVVNVDRDSPNRGMRTPIIASFRPDNTVTIGTNRLVVRPYPGFPLDEGTTYALVITTRLHGPDGGGVLRDSDFSAVMGTGGDASIAHAREVYAALTDWLDEPGGDERADVASAAVFTTQHATFVAPAIRKAVFALPAPAARMMPGGQDSTNFTLFTGEYDAPNFQTGEPPYLSDGGEIKVDATGTAIIQRTETIRFAITVPKGPVPATGWPLVIYSHGTGGDWQSFIGDYTADGLGAEGVAVISMDQVLHGPRNPTSDPAISFFNFQNPLATRDNPIQGYADAWTQMRAGLALTFVDQETPPRVHKFDPDRLYFFGHSQGGLTSPGFIAFEPALKGAVLSGTGGVAYLSMLYKQEPRSFLELVDTLARDPPMDADNPSLALGQIWAERADGANYARYMVREMQKTPDGTATLAPRNIFVTEGFTDSYTPNPAIEAFATSLGADAVMLPDTKPFPGLALRGREIRATPFTGNVNNVTAALGQYKAPGNQDGHFVVFDHQAARTQAMQFLGTLARTGKATVVSPP